MKKTHIAGVMAFAFVLFFLTTQPLLAGDTASSPYPTDGDTNGASPDIVVSWTAGDNAAATDGHGVYWGTDYDTVNNATTASDEYMGAQTATTYDPAGSLTAGVTYYWRIDELNPEVSPYVWKGDVWSFIVWDGSGLGDFVNGYATWTVSSMTKVNLTDTLPGGSPNPPSVSIKLAKCEAEGFQVAIEPASGRHLDNVRLVASNLTSGGNTIASSNIDWRVVGVMNWSGNKYPDILLPVNDFDMATGNTHSMLVTVNCPSGQAAGTYTGTVTVKTDSGLDTTVNVTVAVHDFAIAAASAPGAMHLKTSWTLNDFGTSTQYIAYGNFLLSYRMNPDSIYRNGTFAIATLEDWYEHGLTGFNVHKADSLNYAPELTAVGNWLDDLAESEYGDELRDMAYFYGFDEKSREYCETYMIPVFSDLKDLWPDIPTLNCSRMYMPPWADPIGDMEHFYMDWVTAEQGSYTFADGELLRSTVDPYLPDSGRYQYWGYNAAYAVSGAFLYGRTTFWNAYQQKADGFLYYCTNGWVDYPNPTPIDPDDGPIIDYTFPTGYSDSVLLYVGTEGPLASMRMVNLRDGMEDYEYLWAIGHYDTDGTTRLGKIASVETARELAEMVTSGWAQATTDSAEVMSARDAIVAWLEQAYVAKYPTPEHRSKGVSPTPTLTWQADSVDVDSFNVYFGTDKDAVLYADTDSDAYIGNQEGATYAPGTLVRSNVTYYWRIDEVVDAAVYTGYVWSFECGYGLVGWWKFDETTGADVKDWSGLGHDGVIVGTVNHVDGALSNGLGFVRNGTVSIPAEALATLENQVTISFWQYGDPCQPQYEFVFHATTDGSLNVFSALVPMNDYTVRFSAGNGSPNDCVAYASLYEMKNRWNHWTFTKNSDTGYMKIYLNGVPWASNSGRTVTIDTAANFRIGALVTGQYGYEGILDDFRVYDCELSQTEVAELFSSYNVTPALGLVGHWTFDEAAGTTAKDDSDYLGHGTITNATHETGKVGGSLDFNGSSAYVDVPIPDCDFSEGMTVSVWQYGDAANQPGNDMLFEATKSTGYPAFRARVPWGTGVVWWECGTQPTGGDTDNIQYTPADPSEYRGQWNHWVFSKSTSSYPWSYQMRIYLNGEKVRDVYGWSAYIGVPTSFKIGSNAAGNNYFYDGMIDDMMMYNYQRTDDEVTALYNSRNAAFSGLIGRWKFDEDEGSTAQDETAFDNDGDITGAAWVPGVTGSALDFEGADYVSVAAAALSELDRKVTVTLWQYGDPAIQPQYDNIIDARDANSQTVFTWYLPEDYGVAVRTYVGGANGASDLSYKLASESEYEGTWHHWAFTKNAWTGNLKVYLDGALWNSTTNCWRPLPLATAFKIGSSSTGTLNYDGIIDGVRVYNTELSADEIEAIVTEAPPLPNPSTWATEPYTTGPSSVLMTATTATHDNGVEYYFECTVGGGNNSGWQDSPSYEDIGLAELTEYTYRVKTRDATNQVEGGWSSALSATTLDGTAPTPNPMTFATPPYTSALTSITMVASTASDPSDVEYFFTCTGGGGNDSIWQDETTYTDSGLSEDTEYTYTVKARDKSVGQNETAASGGASATTGATLLTDGFETSFDNWTDGGTTDWDRDTSQKHTDTYSAHAGKLDNDLISDNLDTSGYDSIRIVFWYRDDDIDDDDDVYLQVYDGTNYDNRVELGNDTEDTWHECDITITNTGGDAEYFHANFRIKFEGSSIDNRENLWIDDAVITAW